jgi:hypothetical protein
MSRLADLPRFRTELTLANLRLASWSANEAVHDQGSLLNRLGTGVRVSGLRGLMRPSLIAALRTMSHSSLATSWSAWSMRVV